MFKKSLICIIVILFTCTAFADIKTQAIPYSLNDENMEGYLAYDDSIKTKKPGIIIVHDWMGLGAFTKQKAEELAKQGYIAFAVDIYGKGNNPKNTEEAALISSQFKNDRQLLRSRMLAAYKQLSSMKMVDPKKILVMGYCFGGTAALELARTGSPLVGTVVFHGGLSNPTPADAKHIKGEVLVLNGEDDPHVTQTERDEFKKEMQNANIKVTFIEYPGAVHAFTNPEAGNDKSKGIAYNAEADKKSWEEFQRFLQRIFNK